MIINHWVQWGTLFSDKPTWHLGLLLSFELSQKKRDFHIALVGTQSEIRWIIRSCDDCDDPFLSWDDPVRLQSRPGCVTLKSIGTVHKVDTIQDSETNFGFGKRVVYQKIYGCPLHAQVYWLRTFTDGSTEGTKLGQAKIRKQICGMFSSKVLVESFNEFCTRVLKPNHIVILHVPSVFFLHSHGIDGP